MTLVIAARGEKTEKIVDGQPRRVVPFVGADREGEFAQMGVGLTFPDENTGTIWGLVIPHALIQSWRGMKILEYVDRIDSGTLSACWYAARREVHESQKRYIDELAEQFGGPDALRAVRDEVLDSAPDAEELELMITALREKGVGVDSWELEQEVEAGRIAMSDLIETLMRETEERKEAYRIEEEEISRPLPREESLSAFFQDLGIGNFINGEGFGGYGIDWGHVELDDLDSAAKRDSFSKYLEDEYVLEHTTEGPETSSAKLGPGVTIYQTSFGEIEKPWFVANDGIRYVFLSTKFRDGRFHIKTLTESGDTVPVEGEYTIPQLREMIGELPKRRRSWIYRLLHRNG